MVSVNSLLSLIKVIIFIIFIGITFVHYKKNKNKSSLYFIIFLLGFMIQSLFGFIRPFFYNNIDLDLLFWRLSAIGSSIGTSAFFLLFLEFFYSKKNRVYKNLIIFYFIIFFVSFVILPATRQDLLTYSEWQPHIIGKYLVYIITILSLILSTFLLVFGFMQNIRKVVIFSIGFIILIFSLGLDALGVGEWIIFYKISAIMGNIIMFYSIIFEKK